MPDYPEEARAAYQDWRRRHTHELGAIDCDARRACPGCIQDGWNREDACSPGLCGTPQAEKSIHRPEFMQGRRDGLTLAYDLLGVDPDPHPEPQRFPSHENPPAPTLAPPKPPESTSVDGPVPGRGSVTSRPSGRRGDGRLF